MATSKITRDVYDSGWLTLVSGVFYRKIGNVVYVEASNLSSIGSNVTIATLPSGYRPSKRHTESLSYPINVNGYVNIETSGTIAVINATSTTLNNVYFSATFVT